VSQPTGALRDRGVLAALAAALLFGAAAPAAKLLLEGVGPWLLAGLLYAGAGVGLLVWRRLRRAAPVALAPGDWRWLAGAVAAGGVAAPVLLMAGLAAMPASGASLLLNAESVFTALLAWVVCRENVDRRVALGMVAIAGGAILLSWPGEGPGFGPGWPSAAVLAACLLWAVDNNLARRVSYADATWLAMVKGLAAGSVNLGLALLVLGEPWPSAAATGTAMITGFAAYGVSLALFVYGLRTLGTARTGAYFAVAPFVGAVLAVVLLGEPVTGRLLAAGALMAAGVWLHLTERHLHTHRHEALEHAHPYHRTDPHHAAAEPLAGQPTRHRHPADQHRHPHYPDLHHRHPH
jgi:drug/metabolite transporter (DMT)-like permease